jgi:hypothetical protein
MLDLPEGTADGFGAGAIVVCVGDFELALWQVARIRLYHLVQS